MQKKFVRGRDLGLKRCSVCGKTVRVSDKKCPRCYATVHIRKPHSIAKTLSHLFVALLLYIPANILPMLTFTKLGKSSQNTIWAGVVTLYKNGMPNTATIVFVASIIIPVFKIIGLSILVVFTRYGSYRKVQQGMYLYRFIEFIGRWSMLDIFVIGTMLTLLNFAPFVTLVIDKGTSAFGAVVIFTMMASFAFDPRLLWDGLQHKEKC